ncbi:hypothetical protein MFIFM68171_00173 [Madurella fahalii]|uniref:Uncharacterized protein n=1 Tax=Madurella fahalii TaxID=1157608 RepID=A0ABQ0FWT3_9PEZI
MSWNTPHGASPFPEHLPEWSDASFPAGEGPASAQIAVTRSVDEDYPAGALLPTFGAPAGGFLSASSGPLSSAAPAITGGPSAWPVENSPFHQDRETLLFALPALPTPRPGSLVSVAAPPAHPAPSVHVSQGHLLGAGPSWSVPVAAPPVSAGLSAPVILDELIDPRLRFPAAVQSAAAPLARSSPSALSAPAPTAQNTSFEAGRPAEGSDATSLSGNFGVGSVAGLVVSPAVSPAGGWLDPVSGSVAGPTAGFVGAAPATPAPAHMPNAVLLTDRLVPGRRNRKYEEFYTPVPDGVEEAYWNRVFCRAHTHISRVNNAQLKNLMKSGAVYQRSLRVLVKDVVRSLDNATSGEQQTKNMVLRQTSVHLDQQSPLIVFLLSHNIILTKSVWPWPSPEENPRQHGGTHPELGWQWLTNVDICQF